MCQLPRTKRKKGERGNAYRDDRVRRALGHLDDAVEADGNGACVRVHGVPELVGVVRAGDCLAVDRDVRVRREERVERGVEGGLRRRLEERAQTVFGPAGEGEDGGDGGGHCVFDSWLFCVLVESVVGDDADRA